MTLTPSSNSPTHPPTYRSNFHFSTQAFAGIGAFSYLGAGVSVWVGSPQAVYGAIYSFHGLGGVAAQSAGFMTWVGCPVFAATAIVHFAGLGGIYWQGAGGAVVALSPVYLPAALAHVDGNADNFYVAGHSFTKGKGLTYIDKKTGVVTSNTNNGSAKVHHERRRRGKRYLKSMAEAVPFPWEVEEEASSSSDNSRIFMYKTKTFESNDVSAAAVASIQEWVPAKMLEAADLFQSDAGFTELRQQQKDKPSRNTLYVGEGTDACGVCEVDSVVGPGAQNCETDCGVTVASESSSATGTTFVYEDINFEASHLVLGELTLLTSDKEEEEEEDTQLMDGLQLQHHIQHWLRTDAGLPDVQATVFSDAHEGLTSQWLTTASSSVKGTAACPKGRMYRLAFVAHDTDTADVLEKALREGGDPSLVSSIKEEEGVCDVATTAGERLVVPAYSSPEFLQASALFGKQQQQQKQQKQQGAASIHLLDPAQPGLPLGGGLIQDLLVGNTYTLQLTGFPARTPMSVAVLDTTTSKEAAAIPLTTDSTGAATKAWVVPSTLPPGDYFLQVMRRGGGGGGGGSSVLGFSSMYSVAKKGRRRRKLFGPTWVV